jgi:hypothetical protein
MSTRKRKAPDRYSPLGAPRKKRTMPKRIMPKRNLGPISAAPPTQLASILAEPPPPLPPPTEPAAPPTELASTLTELASPSTELASPPAQLASPPTQLASTPTLTEPASPPTQLASTPTELASTPSELASTPTQLASTLTEPPPPPTEPAAPPTEPAAPPTELTATLTEPASLPTEPAAPPTELTTTLTEPASLPTEPAAPPTELASTLTEPASLPTEPASLLGRLRRRPGRPSLGGPIEANKRYRRDNEQHKAASRDREYRYWVKRCLNKLPTSSNSILTSILTMTALYTTKHNACPLALDKFIYHTVTIAIDTLGLDITLQHVFSEEAFNRMDPTTRIHFQNKRFDTVVDNQEFNRFNDWFVKNKRTFYDIYVMAGMLARHVYLQLNTPPDTDYTAIEAAC